MPIEGDTTTPSTVRWNQQLLTYPKLEGSHYDKVKQLVNARWEQGRNFARDRYEAFYRFEKLIRMITKRKAYDWKANAFLPYGLALAEQSAAMKWLALFTSRPYVTVQARKAGLDEAALRRQGLIDWHLTGDVDIVKLGSDMFRQSERYGKAVAVVAPEWNQKLMRYREMSQLPTALGPVARAAWKGMERREYRVRATALDLTDFVPQPGKRRINGPEGMQWCFRQYWFSRQELEMLEQAQLLGPAVGGQSIAELEGDTPVDADEYKLRRLLMGRSGTDPEAMRDQFDPPIHCKEYQGMVPSELLDPAVARLEEVAGRNPYHRLIIVANDRVVLEDIALPWDHGMKSYVEMDCVADPHDFWGTGKVEPSEHLVYVGNEIMNLRLDNVKMAINALVGVHGQRMPVGWRNQLLSQPFGVIETHGPPNEIIQRLAIGDVTGSSYEEQQQIWTLIQEANAVNETLMGGPGPARTLGEHQLKAETASKRLQFELIHQAQQLLGFPYGVSGHVIGLDRQYLPLPTFIKLTDAIGVDDFMEFEADHELFSTEDEQFSYTATGALEGLNIQAKREDLVNMLGVLQPFMPVLMSMGFNLPELVRTIIKTFGHDPTRYFPQVAGMAQAGQGGMMGAPGMFPGAPVPPGAPPTGQPPGAAPGQPQSMGPGVPGNSPAQGMNPMVMAAMGGLLGGPTGP